MLILIRYDTVRETEAEAVAFIVGQAVGLEMGATSSDYIQLYRGNLEVVQHAAFASEAVREVA
jgi:hypothetical protein